MIKLTFFFIFVFVSDLTYSAYKVSKHTNLQLKKASYYEYMRVPYVPILYLASYVCTFKIKYEFLLLILS